MKVFLSSTYQDLISERNAVRQAIHRMSMRYSGMEYFGSYSGAPLERCLEKVRAANVVVLIVADRYGFVPEGAEKSITELEYREALSAGIPVLVYVRRSPYGSSDERLGAFRVELAKSHGITEFTSEDDLAWKVVSDLAREFSPQLRADVDGVTTDVFFKEVSARVNELVAVLEPRAARIRAKLREHYSKAPVEDYLARFDDLHNRHVKALKQGQFILAHEILGEIHTVSFELSSEDFWTDNHGLYSLRDDAFQRGVMICAYVVGRFESYSEHYPSHEGYVMGWRLHGAENPPSIAAALYERIIKEPAS
jgi:hypothetical protein